MKTCLKSFNEAMNEYYLENYTVTSEYTEDELAYQCIECEEWHDIDSEKHEYIKRNSWCCKDCNPLAEEDNE